MPAGDEGGGREFSHAVIHQVINLVRQRVGEAGVAGLLASIDEERPVSDLEDLTGWSSYGYARSFLEAAAEVLGGSERLRDLAHHWARGVAPGEAVTPLRSLGSPAEVLRHIPQVIAKLSTAVAMEATDVDESGGTVVGWHVEGLPRFRELCDWTTGALGMVPMIFGFGPADVSETACVVDGAERCVFSVRWSLAPDTEQRVAALEAEIAALTARFDGYQRTVAGIVSGGDTERLLARITGQASVAVRAPAHLLAVRMADGAPMVVHQSGLLPGEVDGTAAEILAEEPDLRGGARIVLDVASESRSYGRIAALNPDGARFLPGDRALLAAYAGLAAAVLDSAALLDSARREAAVAGTLLELAQALAEATTPLAMARQLAVVVPRVVDCDRVSVHLYDHTAGFIRPSAFVGYPPDVERLLADMVISPADTPLIAKMVDHPEPLHFTDEHDDPFIRGMVRLTGALAVAVVPLVSSGRFYGVVTAGVVEDESRLELREEHLARLRALAAQSSTALRNAELVARIQHDALHDALTGLPNRTSLEDRTTQALHHSQRDGHSVALLFVDIDHFKTVNDTYGHRDGDDVLRQVGARLTGAVRSADTVARLGGDEFVVLVVDADAAAASAVAAKLLAAFEQPFALADGRTAPVTCSIGIATASGATDVDSLIDRADGAMYKAKAAGRNTSAVAES